MFYGWTSKKLDIITYFDTSIEHNTRTSIEHPLDDGCLQGTFGSLPTIFCILPNVVVWQGAIFAGCQCGWQGAKIWKRPRPKHRVIAQCEVYLSIYITYYLVSKPTPWAMAGPHGQLASLIFVVTWPNMICATVLLSIFSWVELMGSIKIPYLCTQVKHVMPKKHTLIQALLPNKLFYYAHAYLPPEDCN